MQNVKREPVKTHEYRSYHRTQMRKELVLHKLREQGCRITKQRLMLLDIILEEEYSNCKEIYFKAMKLNDSIGTATVYRMINTLESIGAISRNNMYKISCGEECEVEDACTIELDDHTTYQLSTKNWNTVIMAGLKACGYVDDQGVRSIVVRRCDCEQ